MGKGDIKTKRGKRANSSYGKHRVHKKAASTASVATKAKAKNK